MTLARTGLAASLIALASQAGAIGLCDAPPTSRIASVCSLGDRRGDPKAAAALAASLGDPDRDVRYAAACAIVSLESADPRLLAAVLVHLSSSEDRAPLVRNMLAVSLGASRSPVPDALKALFKTIPVDGDVTPAVRGLGVLLDDAASAAAVVRADDALASSVVASLDAAASRPSSYVRLASSSALRALALHAALVLRTSALGPQAVGAALRLREDSDGMVRADAEWTTNVMEQAGLIPASPTLIEAEDSILRLRRFGNPGSAWDSAE